MHHYNGTSKNAFFNPMLETRKNLHKTLPKEVDKNDDKDSVERQMRETEDPQSRTAEKEEITRLCCGIQAKETCLKLRETFEDLTSS